MPKSMFQTKGRKLLSHSRWLKEARSGPPKIKGTLQHTEGVYFPIKEYFEFRLQDIECLSLKCIYEE